MLAPLLVEPLLTEVPPLALYVTTNDPAVHNAYKVKFAVFP